MKFFAAACCAASDPYRRLARLTLAADCPPQDKMRSWSSVRATGPRSRWAFQSVIETEHTWSEFRRKPSCSRGRPPRLAAGEWPCRL